MAGAISKFMRKMTEIVMYSSFVEGDSEDRHGSILLISIYVLLSVLCSFKGPLTAASSFALLSLSQMFYKSTKNLKAGIALSAIPASWFMLTSYLLTFSLPVSAWISFRAFMVAFSILTGFSQINPIELASAIKKGSSLYICLTWKSTPHIMRDMETSLLVNELKGEPIWKSIAVSLLCVKEYSEFYSEGLHTRLESFQPRFKYSRKVLVFQALLSSLLLLGYLFLPSI